MTLSSAYIELLSGGKSPAGNVRGEMSGYPSIVSCLSSRPLVPSPSASFQLLLVFHPSIFSLVVLSSSFPFLMRSIIPFSNPPDRMHDMPKAS